MPSMTKLSFFFRLLLPCCFETAATVAQCKQSRVELSGVVSVVVSTRVARMNCAYFERRASSEVIAERQQVSNIVDN